jgi:membrane fusion protein (multidrug efflux system)
MVAGLGCRGDGESAAEAADSQASFPVTSPTLQDVVLRRDYVAEIRAARHAEVHTRLKGIVESVSVDEGQPVRRGQTLFTIDARARKQTVAVARAGTLAAEADLHAAELELANTQLLTDKNIVSTAELERSKSKVQISRARLAEARANVARTAVELDHADIKAPFDGVVNRIPYKVGSAVGEDDLLTTVTDAREVLAYFSISEREYLSYFKGGKALQSGAVALVLADGSRFDHEGHVDAVGSELDAQTGTLSFRARFPNPEGLLKHGSSGTIVIETKLAGALLVPQAATFEVQGDVYVYALDAQNVAHARKIHVNHRLDRAFVVDGGLARGDRFVLEGIQQIKDGMRIVPRDPD